MKKFIEIFGWYGTIAIVLAYALVSFSVLSTNSLTYQLLNGTGALGIIVVSIHKRNYQPAVLDCIWASIALIAIGKILL
jgi:hypothetical protein